MRPPRRTEHEPLKMSRRDAARRLLMLPLAALPASGALGLRWSASHRTSAEGAQVTSSTPPVYRGYVAGFQFHDGPELVSGMEPGESVSLVREPRNRHDQYAVRVDYRGRKIGYVPQTVSQHVASQMGDGVRARGVISAVDAAAVPWRAVQIRAV